MRSILKLNTLKRDEFKRVVGVTKELFSAMLFEWTNYRKMLKNSFGIGGRKRLLTEEEEILIMIQYYREYRTFEQIGFDFGISEPTARRTVKTVETVLIKSNKFSLPNKNELYANSSNMETILIDTTEIAIKRSKKNKKNIILEKRNNIL